MCGKAFARAKQLEVHNSTHLKAGQCEICNQGYLSETSLMKHRIKEHSQYKISWTLSLLMLEWIVILLEYLCRIKYLVFIGYYYCVFVHSLAKLP